MTLPAADRRQDMDDGCGSHGGREVGRQPVHEHVVVWPEPRPGLDQAVAQAGHGPVEYPDDGADGLALDLVPPRRPGKEREQ